MESPEVFNGFYNRGFVAMWYFGHLRRNPDDTGYNNWLQELNLNRSYRT